MLAVKNAMVSSDATEAAAVWGDADWALAGRAVNTKPTMASSAVNTTEQHLLTMQPPSRKGLSGQEYNRMGIRAPCYDWATLEARLRLEMVDEAGDIGRAEPVVNIDDRDPCGAAVQHPQKRRNASKACPVPD